MYTVHAVSYLKQNSTYQYIKYHGAYFILYVQYSVRIRKQICVLTYIAQDVINNLGAKINIII
jgi:hypothetical protein